MVIVRVIEDLLPRTSIPFAAWWYKCHPRRSSNCRWSSSRYGLARPRKNRLWWGSADRPGKDRKILAPFWRTPPPFEPTVLPWWRIVAKARSFATRLFPQSRMPPPGPLDWPAAKKYSPNQQNYKKETGVAASSGTTFTTILIENFIVSITISKLSLATFFHNFHRNSPVLSLVSGRCLSLIPRWSRNEHDAPERLEVSRRTQPTVSRLRLTDPLLLLRLLAHTVWRSDPARCYCYYSDSWCCCYYYCYYCCYYCHRQAKLIAGHPWSPSLSWWLAQRPRGHVPLNASALCRISQLRKKRMNFKLKKRKKRSRSRIFRSYDWYRPLKSQMAEL